MLQGKNVLKYEHLNEDIKRSDLMKTAQDALLAGAIHVHNLFGKSLDEIGVEYKIEDGDSPRTLIDKNAEKAALEVIADSPFKDDLIVAEESGKKNMGIRGKYSHYLDPYDGTSNAAIKLAMSTMGLAIADGNEVILSVIINPFEMKMYCAEKGKGAYMLPLTINASHGLNSTLAYSITGNPQPLKLHNPPSAKERYAWVDAFFNEHTSPRKTGWVNDSYALAPNVRMTGSNIDYSSKLAEGRGQIQLTDAVGGFFDLAPGIVLIRELGGEFTDQYGNIPKPGCEIGVASVDSKLHEQVLKITEKHYGKNHPLGEYSGFRGPKK